MQRVFFKDKVAEEKIDRVYFTETQEFPEKESDFYVEIRELMEDGEPCWRVYLGNKTVPALIPTSGYATKEEALDDIQSLMNSDYMNGVITRYLRDYCGEEVSEEKQTAEENILDEMNGLSVIGNRTYNILRKAGLNSKEALLKIAEEEIKNLPHVTEDSVKEIIHLQYILRNL